MRHIKVPFPITLHNPHTMKVLRKDDGTPEEVVSFRSFINNLLTNPKWVETYTNLKAASVISTAVNALFDGEELVLPEDAWRMLSEAAMFPKQIIVTPNGPVVVVGFGFHPQVSVQLIPMLDAIFNATLVPDPQEATPPPPPPASLQ